MKIAVISDSLMEFGGSERLLQAVLRLYPEAHVMTLFADPTLVKRFFPNLSSHKLHTLPYMTTKLYTHTSLVQSWAPLLWKQFRLDSYDLVISILAHLMCNFVSVKGTHVQYIQTPSKNIFGMIERTPLQKLTRYDRYIIPRYRQALMSTPYVLTNSHHVERVIKRLFGIQSSVLYPPVVIPKTLPKRNPRGSYFLTVGRLDRVKHLEVAIRACNTLKLPLKIVGKTNEPRYERHLCAIAGPTISFEGFLSDTAIEALYVGARGFLFTAKEEDFGIAPIEALAHGVPVIAHWGGGIKETMIPHQTGEVFTRHSSEALVGVLRRFDPKKYPPAYLYRHAKRFGEDHFLDQLDAYVNKAMRKQAYVASRRISVIRPSR